MQIKQSHYDMNILNTLNPDINYNHENIQNISNKINININDKNISNLYKRDTSRSQYSNRLNTEPNTKDKKSKKNQVMTKEQRNVLKELLKENEKENQKRIAKNLVDIFLESNRNIKNQTNQK